MSLRPPSFVVAREAEASSIAAIGSAKAFSVKNDLVEQLLLWAFIGALAWCPFLFGSNVLLARV